MTRLQPETLRRLVAVAAGHQHGWPNRRSRGRAGDAPSLRDGSPITQLTLRELTVPRLLSTRLSNREMAPGSTCR